MFDMKQILLFAYFLLSSLFAVSQNFNYTLAIDSIGYQNLINPTYLLNNSQWADSTTFGIKLPFKFSVSGSQSDSISIFPNGFIEFNNSNSVSIVALNNFSVKRDSANNFNSHLAYTFSGTIGNRQLVLEYFNFSNNKLSDDDFITFQIHINEANSSVEFLFGPSSYNNSIADIPFHLGLLNRNMTFEFNNGIFISGFPNMVELKSFYITDENMGYMSTFPNAGNRFILIPF